MTNILIDPGSYDCRNMGDMAMLKVAVARVRELEPDVAVHVLTDDSTELARHCTDVNAVSHSGRKAWTSDALPLYSLLRVLPHSIRAALARIKRAVRQRWPRVHRLAMRAWAGLRGRDDSGVTAFMAAMQAAQFLLVCGQGTLADAGKPHAMTTLRTVETAIQMGKPVALMGQGVGQMRDPELSGLVGILLPNVGLIGLREGRTGLPVLRSLGVAPSRVVVTGDDAVELAYRAKNDGPLGGGLGVHARRAPLAISDDGLLEQLGILLKERARVHGAPLIPLPISRHRVGADDARTIRKMLTGSEDDKDGGDGLSTPMSVIAEARRCRIVVTGAYHAAVFALAQGIPAVCYARSEYYLEKFRGLADQFGPGCYVVAIGDHALPDGFAAVIDEAWQAAEQTRPSLLQAAARQLAVGRAAYRRMWALLNASAPTDRSAADAAFASALPALVHQPAGQRAAVHRAEMRRESGDRSILDFGGQLERS